MTAMYHLILTDMLPYVSTLTLISIATRALMIFFSNGLVEDRSGYKIKLYDDTLEILRLLKSKGICLATASR